MFVRSGVGKKLGCRIASGVLALALAGALPSAAWALMQPFPDAGFWDLNDNAVPAGFNLVVDLGNVALKNQHLEAGPGDSYGWLDLPGTLPTMGGIQPGRLEMGCDTHWDPTYHGISTALGVGIGADYFYFVGRASQVLIPGQMNFRIYRNDLNDLIMDKSFALDPDASFNYYVSLTQGTLEFATHRLSDNSQLFDYATTDPLIQMGNIHDLQYLVYSTASGGDSWEDNLSMKFSPVPEPTSLISLGLGLLAAIAFRKRS